MFEVKESENQSQKHDLPTSMIKHFNAMWSVNFDLLFGELLIFTY